MPLEYRSVKKLSLYVNKEKVVGSKVPDLKNGNVTFDVSLEPGRYSFAAWTYEDSGNMMLQIQRVIVSDESPPQNEPLPPVGSGFDDNSLGGGFDD